MDIVHAGDFIWPHIPTEDVGLLSGATKLAGYANHHIFRCSILAVHVLERISKSALIGFPDFLRELWPDRQNPCPFVQDLMDKLV